MMRALIVDDELHAREELEALLVQTGEFDIVGRSANAVEAIQAIRRERPDVVFLDIQMPAISGLELLAMLEDAELPRVVFVTAHDEFALRAFEASAIDYLLKPVEAERLAKTLEKLRELPRPFDRERLPPATIKRIPCLAGRAIKLLGLAEVEAARSSEAGVYVLGPRGELFTELTLKVLEERAGLVRCHKQFLVNVEAVDEVHLEEGIATIRTRSGMQVPVSRRFLPKLRERLGI
jgi:two-component system, LytTR family, response regulator